MKLEQQVLSMEQVQELQELGFDVNKYATFVIAEGYYDGNKYIVNEKMLNNEVIYNEIREYFPTLTIGDIMDILPTFIEIGSSKITYKLGINNSNIQYFNNNNIFIRFENNTQIYRLFQCLKWCIKQKHIEL